MPHELQKIIMAYAKDFEYLPLLENSEDDILLDQAIVALDAEVSSRLHAR